MATPFIDHLWTTDSTLRLRDTSGQRDSQREACIYCGKSFTPGAAGAGNSPACPECSELFHIAAERPRSGDPEGELRCLLCAKLYAAHLSTGTQDQICPSCRNSFKDAAKLVCATCNITICRLAPKVLDNGFVIRPNQVLHSDHCNICKPNLKESNVIEIDLWNKTQRPKKTIAPVTSGPSGYTTRSKS